MIDSNKVKELHAEGLTITEISNSLGCSYASVYQIHRNLNLEPNRRASEVHKKIIQLVTDNPKMTYTAISKMFNCTRQNISAVCRSNKVHRRPEQGEEETKTATSNQ